MDQRPGYSGARFILNNIQLRRNAKIGLHDQSKYPDDKEKHVSDKTKAALEMQLHLQPCICRHGIRTADIIVCTQSNSKIDMIVMMYDMI